MTHDDTMPVEFPATSATEKRGVFASKELLGGCAMCGKPTRDKLCLTCCHKVTPKGPPLKRLRRYGFNVTYRLRECMIQAREITGSIPTEAEPETGSIKVSYLFVACDGNTYVGHEWIYPGGSSYSWSEPYPPNAKLSDSESTTQDSNRSPKI